MDKKLCLTVDGGGSSLRAILFDENFEIRGQGLAGGVNTNYTTEADARANVRRCLEQVFSGTGAQTGAAGKAVTARAGPAGKAVIARADSANGGTPADEKAAAFAKTAATVVAAYAPAAGTPVEIDKLYVVFIGNVDFLLDELRGFAAVREVKRLSEPETGLMAGAMWRSGIVALAGTGTNFSLTQGKRAAEPRRAEQRRYVVGGWGPVLGDEGSGAIIGQKAVRAAIAGQEGWGEPTLMLDLIRRDWRLKDDWDMVEMVYQSPSPFRKVASLTRLVAEAADAGDAAARRILAEAGQSIAVQIQCLIDRFEIPPEDFRLVCCGGVWKTHPLIYETFCCRLAETSPGLTIRKPRFEQIMAGPAFEMLDRLGGDETEQNLARAADRLAGFFPDFIIRW